MTPIDTALILKALDGLHQRYLYTAQNIANANTPDYRAARVNFEDALRRASEQDLAAVRSVDPEVTYDVEDLGPMRLDLEIATAGQTAARYRALMDILGRQLALHRIAVSGRQ
jgi:flagellar basal-body rod protein FlgB